MWLLFVASYNFGLQKNMQLKVKNNLLLISILLAALGIRLIHSNQSFWLDEAAQAIESARPLREQLAIAGDFQPPLFHLVVFVFERVSQDEWFLRLASILPALATIWGASLIASKIYGDKTGKLTALLGTLSAYHYYYSQELRPYSLSAMFAVFSMYFFLDLLDSKSKKIAASYIMVSALALYSSYLSGFLLLTQLAIVLMQHRARVWQLVKHQAIVALVFMPWLPFFWEQFQNGTKLTEDYVGWSTAVSLPLIKALPLTLIKFFGGMIRVDFTFRDAVLILSAGSIIAMILVKAVKKTVDRAIALWAFLPISIAFVVSFAVPVLEPKRVLFCLPAFWILLAKGLVESNKSRLKASVFLCLYSLPLLVHLTDSSLLREDWRGSVSYIESHAGKDAITFFAFPGEFAPYTWYKNDTMRSVATKIFTIPNEAFLNENVKEVLLSEQVFVYDYLMDLSDPNRLAYSWLKENGFVETATTDFRGVGFVRTFAKTVPIALQP